MLSDSIKDYNNNEDIIFAAILTGKEEIPEIDTYDAGLATLYYQADYNKRKI